MTYYDGDDLAQRLFHRLSASLDEAYPGRAALHDGQWLLLVPDRPAPLAFTIVEVAGIEGLLVRASCTIPVRVDWDNPGVSSALLRENARLPLGFILRSDDRLKVAHEMFGDELNRGRVIVLARHLTGVALALQSHLERSGAVV
jgi:hypothetical protein